MNTLIELPEETYTLGDLIKSGSTAEIFEFSTSTFSGVIKLFFPFIPEEWARTEYQNTLIAGSKLSFSVQTYGIVKVKSRIGLLLNLSKGISLSEYVLKHPSKLLSIPQKMAEIHTQIHEVNTVDELPELEHRFFYSLTRLDFLPDEKKEKLQQYFHTLPKGTSLCHGDFHFGNLLLSSSKAQSVTLLDWGDTHKGNAMYDVCRTYLLLKSPSEKPVWIYRFFATFIKRRIAANYLNAYQKITGCTPQDLEKWEIIVAVIRLSEIDDIKKREWWKNIVLQHITVIQVVNQPSLSSF